MFGKMQKRGSLRAESGADTLSTRGLVFVTSHRADLQKIDFTRKLCEREYYIT